MKIMLTDEDRAMLKRSADSEDRTMKHHAKYLIREAIAARAAKSDA